MEKNNQEIKGNLAKANLIIKKNKKQIFSLVLLSTLFLVFVSASSLVNAGTLWDAQMGKTDIGQKFGANDGTAPDAKDLVADIIRTVLSYLGLLMTIIILWAGFRWMTAGGDEKKVETAKSHLRSAVIGAIVIIAAWMITFFVVDTTRKAITNSIW